MTRARELADLLTGGQTITTDDNTAQLTVKSTDADANSGPLLVLTRDSGSPADGDNAGLIQFKFDNDAGDDFVSAAQISAKANDVSNGSEDGELEILTIIGGSSRSRVEMFPSETVLNEDSQDIDFRVEGNGNANMFFVDAGNDKVGVGTNTPSARFSALSTSGTTTDIGRFEAAVGSYTGTSLVAGNTLGAASSYNLFKCISDSDADAGGPVTHFLVRGDGNVGINTDSPTLDSSLAGLSVNSGSTLLHINDTDGACLKLSDPASGANRGLGITLQGTSAAISLCESGELRFGTGNTERMRLDGAKLLINETSTNLPCKLHVNFNGSSEQGLVLENSVNNSSGAAIRFVDHTDAHTGGGVYFSDSNNINYATSSDARLKDNITDMTGSIDRVKALAPKRFNFTSNPDITMDGFLAHEAQAVVPEAVNGTENAVDDDDNPIYQAMDAGRLVPLLTGALKEAIAKIETLETEMTALKARVTALEAE